MSAAPTLDGHVAVVTGTTGAPARATAEALRAAGATVVTVDGPVADAEAAGGVADAVLADHGRLDVLVLHPTVDRPTPLDAPREQALADFDALFAADVATPFLVQRATVGALVDARGHIVVVTSEDVLPPVDGDRRPRADHDLTDATRWTAIGFAQAWALGLRERGVRVNVIATDEGDAARHVATLQALLAEGPDGRTGEVLRAGDGPLPPRRQRGEEIR